MSKAVRWFISILFSLTLATITLIAVQAKSSPAVPAQQQAGDCFSCHPDFQAAWVSGAHAHASNDPLFSQTWVDQGQPGACLVCHVTGYDPGSGTWKSDGVTCQACHASEGVNHPEEPMPVDRSTELCGHCHSDARFGWQEWQTSTHFQRGMTCTICHDPHSASLKAVEGLEAQGPSGLCINCHRDYMTDFPYSNHSQSGVQCVDCHLHHFGASGDRDIHTMPDHSFSANLAACTTCHSDQMHGATAGEAALFYSATATPLPGPQTDAGSVSGQPSPVSPYGFAGLAGLVGLAGGMVLSPWLEKAYRQLNQKGK